MIPLRSNGVEKIPWRGVLLSIQPRIRLGRSFDQRSHTYLGYALQVRGSIGDETREFLVGIGERAHSKHQFRAGDTVSGEAVPVADPRLETVEFYKVSRLKTMRGRIEEQAQPPPWSGVPPPLAVYRERGHRRLASRTYVTVENRRLRSAQNPTKGKPEFMQATGAGIFLIF